MAKIDRDALIHPGMRYLRQIGNLKSYLSELSGVSIEHLTSEKSYSDAAAIIREKHPAADGRVRLIPLSSENPDLAKFVTGALKGCEFYKKHLPDEFAKNNVINDTAALIQLDTIQKTRAEGEAVKSFTKLRSLANTPAAELDSKEAIIKALKSRNSIKASGKFTKKAITKLLSPVASYEIADAQSAAVLAGYIGQYKGRAPATVLAVHDNQLFAARKTTGVRADREFRWSKNEAEHQAFATASNFMSAAYGMRYVRGKEKDNFISAVVVSSHERYDAYILDKSGAITRAKAQLKDVTITINGAAKNAPLLSENPLDIVRQLKPSTNNHKLEDGNFNNFALLKDPRAGTIAADLSKNATHSKLEFQFWPQMNRRENSLANFATLKFRGDAPEMIQNLTTLCINRSGNKIKAFDAAKALETLQRATQIDRPDRHARAFASAPILVQTFHSSSMLKTKLAMSEAKQIPRIVQTYMAERHNVAISTRTAKTMALYRGPDPSSELKLALFAEKFHRGSPNHRPLTVREASNGSDALIASISERGNRVNLLPSLLVTRVCDGLRDSKNRIRPLTISMQDPIKWIKSRASSLLSDNKIADSAVINLVFPEGRRFAGLQKLDQEWHRSINRLTQAEHANTNEVKRRQDERVASNFVKIPDSEFYHHLTDKPVTLNGVTLTPLKSAQAYLDDGKEMNHCVGSYRDEGSTGKLLTFKVASEEGRTTAGYRFRVQEKDGQPTYSFHVFQHTGTPLNPNPPKSHEKAVEDFFRTAAKDLDKMAAHTTQATRLDDYLVNLNKTGYDEQSKAELLDFKFVQLKEFLPKDQQAMTLPEWKAHCEKIHNRIVAKSGPAEAAPLKTAARPAPRFEISF